MLEPHRGMLSAELGVDEGRDVFEVNGIVGKRDLLGCDENDHAANPLGGQRNIDRSRRAVERQQAESINLDGLGCLEVGFRSKVDRPGELKDGVRIFEDMTVTFSEKTDASLDESFDNRLDKCIITVFPPLNPDHERLNLPELMLKTMNIDGIVGDSGAEFRGVDDISSYEDVLKLVSYSNQKPAYYLNRQFKLTCSQVNDRFTSNEYTQTVTFS